MKFGNASGISQSKIESSDVAVLSGERDPSSVRRDASGLVTGFRILKVGPWSVTIDGQQIPAMVDSDDIRKVYDHFAAKGELIPVDCEHLLAYLAELKKVDEATLVRAEPLLGEKAAAGFVRLTSEKDGNELWANVESWSARARELLTVNGDRMYMYFSGVLRGLKDGLLRITSIALTNTPAEDNQAGLIALCGEGALFLSAISTHKETNMTWLKKIGALLQRDVATLTSDASLEPVLQAAYEQIEAATAIFPSFRAQVKDTLKLTGNEDPTQVAGLVLSLAAKSDADTQALTALRTRVTELESAERARLEDRLTAEGKLTQGLRDSAWFKSLDFVALKAWGEVAPVVVKPGRETTLADRAVGGEGVLTEAGRVVALACGCNPEDVAKANGLKVA